MKSFPSWIGKLLRAICPENLYEEIEGDLIELYKHELRTVGERRARLNAAIRALRFLRPGIVLRNKFSFQSNHLPMLRNYFVTSLRHIRKSKINFAFKIGGLSLAIFSFLAITIYISYQLSFDRFHDDYKNIYRVTSERKENGIIEKFGIAPFALGPKLQQDIPGIASAVRIRYANGTYLRYNNNVIDCESLIEADTSIFSVLSFQFIKGDRNALKKPNSIVLTRTMATTIFGTTDVLQKMITINLEDKIYEVTAVVEDMEPNSHLSFSAIVPLAKEHEFNLKSIADPVEFVEASAMLYVRFSKPLNKDLDSKVESLLDRYVSKSDRMENGFRISFQPIKDIYLGPHYRYEFSQKGSAVYVYAFSILGILLLIVAGINYINLSIADVSTRLRETSVRKVLGARGYQLITQVVTETVIFSIISLMLGLALLYLLFPQVRQLDSGLRLELLLEPNVLMTTTFALLTLIFFSAWAPARQFATAGIDQNLKSKGHGYNSSVSRVLLFTQFTISAVCIGCTLMVGQQIGFIHHKELGFDRKNLLVLSMPWEFTVKKMQTFKLELKQIPGVTAVSNSSFRIGGGYWKDWYFVEDQSGMKKVELYEVFSDDELFATLGIRLLSGRTFNASMPSDSGAAFVINETAARKLGWDEPVGKRIYTHPEEKGKWDGTVVGVVSDINISPLYSEVKPLVMRLPWQSEYPDGFVYVRYQGDEQAIVRSIETKYKAIMPGYPLAYRFVDELYNSQHLKEAKVFTSLRFGTLAIVALSALGIFSMAAYFSVKRMKEFGIRKVLGASVQQIAGLHIGYFVRLVLVANVIAFPVAYYLIQEWLDSFAYKTDLTLTPFLLSGMISLLLVILSGGYSAWRSGMMNPIEIIKHE